jgi:cytochrome c2/cytochrome b561
LFRINEVINATALKKAFAFGREDRMSGQKNTGLREAALDYALPLLVLAQDILTTFMPRADKMGPMREELRGFHYLVGTLLFLLAATRLWRWATGRPPQPTPALPPRARTWAMSLVLATYILLFATPILGYLVAWSHDMAVHLGPLPALPALIGENRNVWVFTGYFHSGISTSLLVIKLCVLLSAVYFLFRHGRGLFTAFPRGFGLYALLSFSISLFALSTFKSYERGPFVVGTFLVICVALWGLARLVRRGRDGSSAEGAPRGAILAGIGALILVGVGLYGPHALFRVSPFPKGEMVEAAAHVTSHETPIVVEQLPPETDFERQVRAETFKWCVFCHTFKKGGEHLVGPNLYAIMGQRMASVPNFPYSESLAARGKAGEVWTDEALAQFLANPDVFAPGTGMIISSGNITDPARQQAIITILKRETGSAAP